MAAACRMLGREYVMEGRVIHGQARGRALGMVTANLRPHPGVLLPKAGIYAVRAKVEGDPTWRTGVASLGVRPSFETAGEMLLEAHLFDYHGDLYGKGMEVSMVEWLREEQKFDCAALLAAQMQVDAQMARQALLSLDRGQSNG